MRESKKFILCLLQALVLVIAQLGAQAHAYSHLKGTHGTQGTGGEPQRVHALACTDCVAFAPLLAAAGGATVPVLHLPAHSSDLIAPAALVPPRAGTLSAYRSRAPPSLP